MSGKRKSPGRRPVIDSAAKVAMLAALREGRRLAETAASYGVTLQAFYLARRRDPLFAAAWADAHKLSAEAERRPAEAGGEGEARIASNRRRPERRRRIRRVRFDERRKEAFLDCFARTCDLLAAAAAAGVGERTVYNHLERDPAFAEAFQAALEKGYFRLRAEAVRLRLEAQKRHRSASGEAGSSGEPLALAEGVELDRAMKLLARWDRGGGRLERGEVGRRRKRRWTLEEAIEALDRKLRNPGPAERGASPETAGGADPGLVEASNA